MRCPQYDSGDFEKVYNLLEVLKTPYSLNAETEKYQSIPVHKNENYKTETAGRTLTVNPVEIRIESQLNERRENDEQDHIKITDSEDGYDYFLRGQKVK